MRILILIVLLAFQAKGEQVWNGALAYDPPFKMFTNSQPSTEASPEEVWTFYTTGMSAGTNGVAEVTFSLTSAETAGPPLPTQPLRSVADLKRFLNAMLGGDSRGQYYSVTNIELDGREALMCTTTTNWIPQGPSKWLCSVGFFWEQNAVWQKSTICAITITAERRETLRVLVNSLKTVKLRKRRAAQPLRGAGGDQPSRSVTIRGSVAVGPHR
jgi:hypothetical protein